MHHLRPARMLVGSVTATAVVALSAGPAAAVITPQTGPVGASVIAAAIAAPGTSVSSASFQTTTAGTPNGTSDSALGGLPTEGASFGIMTTGDVGSADDPNTNVPDSSGALDDTSTDNGGPNVAGRGNTAYDISVLEVDLAVPSTANCLTLDFKFFSEEFQEYVGTSFNDAFIAELDSSTWTTAGSSISAPGNFAFGPAGEVISINTSGNTSMTAAHAAGTTYDGATPLLSASKPVTPGAHSLYLSIFDQGDRILDSAVFLDNVVVFAVANPTTDCVPGAKPKVNAPPVTDAGGPYTGDEGSAIPLTGSATDPDGDPMTHAWTVQSSTGDIGPSTCTLAAGTTLAPTVTCSDDGTVTLLLTTTDDDGATATDTATVAVGNVAPTVSAVTAPVVPVALGTPVHVSATYTDPASDDTHSAVWNWDDGTTSPGTASGGSASSSRTYGAAGIYTVCVTVTDDDAGAGQGCTPSYVVVYDPSAGFVTGGGSIASPAGAYTPDDPTDPDVTGRANFGFVSKYKKGATAPTGSTEFQFKAGELNLHSSAYEWLVVSGAKATYKGTATVNGTAGYKFLLSAVDGARPGGGGTDRFRIKVWNATTGAVLYDNQAGGADDATPSTAISGGSIVIHT